MCFTTTTMQRNWCWRLEDNGDVVRHDEKYDSENKLMIAMTIGMGWWWDWQFWQDVDHGDEMVITITIVMVMTVRRWSGRKEVRPWSWARVTGLDERLELSSQLRSYWWSWRRNIKTKTDTKNKLVLCWGEICYCRHCQGQCKILLTV